MGTNTNPLYLRYYRNLIDFCKSLSPYLRSRSWTLASSHHLSIFSIHHRCITSYSIPRCYLVYRSWVGQLSCSCTHVSSLDLPFFSFCLGNLTLLTFPGLLEPTTPFHVTIHPLPRQSRQTLIRYHSSMMLTTAGDGTRRPVPTTSKNQVEISAFRSRCGWECDVHAF